MRIIGMDKLIVINGQNIIDLAIAHYSSAEGIMQLWRDNSTIALDDTLVAGSIINAGEAELETNFEILSAEEIPGTEEEITVVSGQNNIDLALTYLGSVEGVMELWRQNTDFEITEVLEGGTKLNRGSVINQRIVDLYRQNKISVATGVAEMPDNSVSIDGLMLVIDDNVITIT